MWKVPCQWSDGKIPELKRGEYMSKFDILEQTVSPPAGQACKQVLFTYKNGVLYAITPQWPGSQLRLKNVQPGPGTKVTFLATQAELPWQADGADLIVRLPPFDPNKLANQHAYAFRICDIIK
jgi:alpha-L-fucosidase